MSEASLRSLCDSWDRGSVLSGDRAASLLALGSIGAFAAVLFVAVRPEFHEFMRSQWLFNYQAGFIRRGLLGQLVVLLPGQPQAVVGAAAALVLCVLVAALIWLAAGAIRALSGAGRLTLPLFLATAPFAGSYFVMDFGRTEQFNFVLAIVSLLVAARGASLLRLSLVASLAAVGILVHEGFLLVCAPLVLAVLVHQASCRYASWWAPIAYGAVTISVLAVTVNLGRPLLPPFEQWQHMAGPGATWKPENEWAMEAVYDSTERIIGRTVGYLSTKRTLVQFALASVYLAPAVVVLLTLGRRIRDRSPDTNRLLLARMCLASLSPLLMTALGTDFFRWIAAALFNATVALLFVLRRMPPRSIALTRQEQSVALAACLLYALLGPLDDWSAGHGPNRLLSVVRAWGT